jgi:hypothetical protein
MLNKQCSIFKYGVVIIPPLDKILYFMFFLEHEQKTINEHLFPAIRYNLLPCNAKLWLVPRLVC